MKSAVTIAIIFLLIIIGVYTYVRSNALSPEPDTVEEEKEDQNPSSSSRSADKQSTSSAPVISSSKNNDSQNQQQIANNDLSETNTNNTQKDVVYDEKITYTANGFSPQTISIERGDTVRWSNESTQKMWVASDVHPSHKRYDGSSRKEHCNNMTTTTFDQCTESDKYTFTFNKQGEWRYHNHMDPTKTGIIVVE